MWKKPDSGKCITDSVWQISSYECEETMYHCRNWESALTFWLRIDLGADMARGRAWSGRSRCSLRLNDDRCMICWIMLDSCTFLVSMDDWCNSPCWYIPHLHDDGVMHWGIRTNTEFCCFPKHMYTNFPHIIFISPLTQPLSAIPSNLAHWVFPLSGKWYSF